MSNIVKLYTDGACRGNPGPGGWGVVISDVKNQEIKLSGYEALTTNNRMEIKAAIMGLNYFKTCSNIAIYTDSNYLKIGITEWIYLWKKKNWKNSSNKSVKNKDLWILLDNLNLFHNVDWNWVKAHNGDIGNEKADKLATGAIDDYLRKSST